MQNCKLNNGLSMPILGFGVYDMHENIAEQAIGWALEAGYRLIDTAASYQNETQVGNAIKKSNIARESLFVTTKVDNPDQGYDNTMRAYEVSLKKLQLDYVDLYLIHWPIKSTRKDTWRALEKIYADKRVKAIGVANYLEPFLVEMTEYLNIVPVINQVEFSPYLYLKELTDYCNSAKIQLQAYSPLARGKRFEDPKLINLAKKYNKTPSQIMLRWIIQHGVSAIPKSATQARIVENISIFDFEISEQDMKIMDTFNENFRVVTDPTSMF